MPHVVGDMRWCTKAVCPIGRSSSTREVSSQRWPLFPPGRAIIEPNWRIATGGSMYFKQFYLGCLAHASYLIGSDGEAAVVDPQRDVDQYIAEAERQGMKIKYVVETHLHADFVSGHHELAERTGAKIVFGAKAGVTFDHVAARDGDVLKIGRAGVQILETPGHTPESISLLLGDPDDPGKPMKVLTGDTLFIGDVGRPDLAGGKGFSAAQMAAMLYDSLHQKLMALPDQT